MIILDATVWIEYLRNNQKYYSVVSALLENKEILAVECVFGELLQGVKNKYEEEIKKRKNLSKPAFPLVRD
jgi:predicted nucleic acid-binding protein